MIELKSFSKGKTAQIDLPSGKRKLIHCKNIGCIFFLLIVTFIIYFPALKNDFLVYDDPEWVTNNIYITSLDFQHLKIFFTTSSLFMYAPLVFISLAVDYKIGGLQPEIFHFTNVVLHLANIVLAFIFLKKLSGKKEIALIAASIFAVHVVNVDTVAWVSTRSNLLYTFFFLTSLVFYIYYLKNNFKLKFYFLSLLLFVLSALSKSAAVILPFILIITDYFLGRKINLKSLSDKIPFFVITVSTGFIALYFRSDVSETQNQLNYSLADKFFIFCYSIVSYIINMVSPFHLSAVYSYPVKHNDFLSWEYYFAPTIFLLFILIINRIKNFRREILFGSLFFFISITISQLGFLEDGFRANRYAYLPYIGLFFIIGNCYDWLSRYKKSVISILMIFILFNGIKTFQRVQVWKDSITLFDDVIEKQKDNAFAYNSRGIAKFEMQNYSGAIEDYSKAILLNSRYPGAFYNRAISYYSIQNFQKAMEDYNKAIELNPLSANSYMGRGIIKMDVMKNFEEAIKDYDKAISINPRFAQAYYNRGLAELRSGNIAEACIDFKKVKQLGFSRADELILQHCK